MTKPQLDAKSVGATLALGSVGLMSLGAQPLLYGIYVREAVIGEAQLGLLSSIEVLGIALASSMTISAVKHLPLRLMALGGLLLLGLGNAVLLTAHEASLAMGVRFLSGLGGGILTGLAGASIARTHKVGGWSAAFLLVQAALQYLFVQTFALLQPDAPSHNVQLALGASGLVALGAIIFLPKRMPEPDQDSGHSQSSLSSEALFPLLGAFVFTGGVIGYWAYASVWLESRGVSSAATASLLSLCLAGQMAGSFVSIAIADVRFAALRFTFMLGALLLIAILWLASPTSWLAAVAFGVIWMVIAPIFARIVLDADPSRKGVALIAPAQLSGIAIIPSLIGLAVEELGLDGLMRAFCAVMAFSFISVLPASVKNLRRSKTPILGETK